MPAHVRPSNSTQKLVTPSPAYMELQEASRTDVGDPSILQNPQTQGITCGHEYAPLHPKTRSWEVARTNVNVEKIIGKGAFGQIAKGTAVHLPSRPGKAIVAVKMLKCKELPIETLICQGLAAIIWRNERELTFALTNLDFISV